jgi:hypothetical protein
MPGREPLVNVPSRTPNQTARRQAINQALFTLFSLGAAPADAAELMQF